MITQAELKAVLRYDPDTGIFTWIGRPRVMAGKVAGNVSVQTGYLRIGLGGRPNKIYQAHRLAWLYMTGAWPIDDIDHKNGKRADNRFCNLREVTRSTNLENLRFAKCTSTTGLLGVSTCRDKFQARIKVKGEVHYLGSFSTPQEAHEVYVEAKRRLHTGCTI